MAINAAGAVAIPIGLQSFAIGFVFDQRPDPMWPVIGMILAGVAVDLRRAVLRLTARRAAAFRVFAFPAILYMGCFAARAATDGIGWSTHLWVGSVVFAGLIGWLESYLILAPRSRRGSVSSSSRWWCRRRRRRRPRRASATCSGAFVTPWSSSGPRAARW